MRKRILSTVAAAAVLLTACGNTQPETDIIEVTEEEIAETTVSSEITTKTETEAIVTEEMISTTEEKAESIDEKYIEYLNSLCGNVSEYADFGFADIDSDGKNELLIMEAPVHYTSTVVYTVSEGTVHKIAEIESSDLYYGNGLLLNVSSGMGICRFIFHSLENNELKTVKEFESSGYIDVPMTYSIDGTETDEANYIAELEKLGIDESSYEIENYTAVKWYDLNESGIAEAFSTDESGQSNEKAEINADGNYISPSGWVLDPNVKAADIGNVRPDERNIAYYIGTTSDGVNFYGVLSDESKEYDHIEYYERGEPYKERFNEYVVTEYDGFVNELQTEWYERWYPVNKIYEGDYDNDGQTEYAFIVYKSGGTGCNIGDLTIFERDDNIFTIHSVDSSKLIGELDFSASTMENGNTLVRLEGTDIQAEFSDFPGDIKPFISLLYGYKIKNNDIKFTAVIESYGGGLQPNTNFECDVHYNNGDFTWDNFWIDYGRLADRTNYEYTQIDEKESELVIDLNCDGKTEKIHNINPFGLCELTYIDSEDKEQTIEFDVTSVWGGTWYLSDIRKIINIPEYGHTDATGCGYDIYIYDFSGADVVMEQEIHAEGGYVVDGEEEPLRYFINGEEYSPDDFQSELWNIYRSFGYEMEFDLFSDSFITPNFKLNIEKNTNFVMEQ